LIWHFIYTKSCNLKNKGSSKKLHSLEKIRTMKKMEKKEEKVGGP
jgi:hypothetical protein